MFPQLAPRHGGVDVVCRVVNLAARRLAAQPRSARTDCTGAWKERKTNAKKIYIYIYGWIDGRTRTLLRTRRVGRLYVFTYVFCGL